MRKPLFPRFIGLFGVYILVLTGLVVVQFSRKTAFTVSVGNMVVSGNYRGVADPKASDGSGEQALSGAVRVMFGGMEFVLFDEDGLSAVLQGGVKKTLKVETMIIKDGTLGLSLSDGNSFVFSSIFDSGSEALQIKAGFGRNIQQIELPFLPLRSARLNAKEGGSVLLSFGGESYTFLNAQIDVNRNVVLFQTKTPLARYGKPPAVRPFTPSDYIAASAADRQTYERTISRWRDQSLAYLERAMAGAPDEDTVLAYIAESALRGNYRSAIASTPAAFTDNPQRTHRSAPYFGRLDIALRSISSAEREYSGRISRLVNERTLDVFNEPNIFAYLALRGNQTIASDAAAFIRTLDPASMTLQLVPGVLEGWLDWNTYSLEGENPFEKLAGQALFVLSSTLRISEGKGVFSVQDGQSDLAFALRLGKAVSSYGDAAKLEPWSAIGRSLIVSVIALADASGSVPGLVQLAEAGSSAAPAGDRRLALGKIFQIIGPQTYYPKTLPLPIQGYPGLLAWTSAEVASPGVTSSPAPGGADASPAAPAEGTQGRVLDIPIAFFVGETHYMLIRGIKPFQKIQLYNIDYRTDPRFERYDSSGWAYSASEQTLLLKMKHKTPVEHIRIYY